MSFILDALRKSDARRRESTAPGLNSPEPPQPPRRNRRRTWPLVAVGLILFGLAGASVYLLRPEWLPAGRTASPEEQVVRESAPPEGMDSKLGDNPAPQEDAATIRRRLTEQHGTESGNDRRRMPAEPRAEDGSVAEQKSEGEADGTPPRRKPLAADPQRVVRRQAPRERESEPVEASDATAELERRMAEEARRRREASSRSDDANTPPAPEVTRNRPSIPATNTTERQGSESDEPEPLNSGVSEYVRAWELPLSIRRNLPELKLTIHVFSPEADERFVLINGERHVAGDSIGEVEIVDIRREGAIVDFRSHRFLLEPR